MLSNIVLNEMDQELERRGLKYARWADDFVILLKSKRSAQQVMESITGYLEASLGLPVNREKSEVAKMNEVSFLGFRIYKHRIQVSKESLDKFKRRVRELTHRNNPLSMYQAVRDLNRYLRGWVEYFRIQESTLRILTVILITSEVRFMCLEFSQNEKENLAMKSLHY
ncbi:hypothetical protein ES705_24921 [subsurface metagenome]